jgi:hypothetical protein
MKLALYKDNQVISVIEDVENPEVEGDCVTWANGKLIGIKIPFLLLNDETDINQEVTEELILLDRKTEFYKVDKMVELEEGNEMNALAIMELAEMLLGGGV